MPSRCLPFVAARRGGWLARSDRQRVSARPAAEAPIALVELQREDISTLPALLELLQSEAERRFILFCDDLSFDTGDAGYKSLKAVLDGGIAGRPDSVIF